MQASEKELKCIEISRKFNEQELKSKIEKLKLIIWPILLTPYGYIKRYPLHEGDKVWWKKILFALPMTVHYFVLVPISFTRGIREYFDRKKNLSNRIKKLEVYYHLDNEVSEIKTFSQLWSDKSARVYGYSYESAIYEWVNILYEQPAELEAELEKLSQLAKNRQSEERRKIIGGRDPMKLFISWSSDYGPYFREEIDKHFGQYLP